MTSPKDTSINEILTAVVYRTEAQKVVDESEKVNYNDSDQGGANV